MDSGPYLRISPSDREAIAELTAQKVLAALQRERKPIISGAEAARELGLSYACFKSEMVDQGEIFYAPRTKRFKRKDVERLKDQLDAIDYFERRKRRLRASRK